MTKQDKAGITAGNSNLPSRKITVQLPGTGKRKISGNQ
jgi:hypothetical protein